MKDLVLVKLGGSVITDKSKPFTPRLDIIKKLVKKIKKDFLTSDTDLIIGHGGGSFPHTPASEYQTHKGLLNKNSIKGLTLTGEAAVQINRIVMTEILKEKIDALSFAPLSFCYDKRIFLDPLLKALALRVTPVIYGDVVMDQKIGFTIYSTEKLLDLIAFKLRKNYKKIKIYYFGDTNGVYDDKRRTISLITPKNFNEIKKFLKGSENTDVTGGMIHKVNESLTLVKKLDAEVYIMNALSRGKFTKISK